MFVRTTLSAVALALVAMLMVALAPTGAVAHGVHAGPHAGHAHAAPAKPAGAAVVNDKTTADVVVAEVRAQPAIPVGDETNADCGDRGCCSNGHCSGCGTAIAPASWLCFLRSVDGLLLNPDAAPPAGLASEGPPRPPKSLA